MFVFYGIVFPDTLSLFIFDVVFLFIVVNVITYKLMSIHAMFLWSTTYLIGLLQPQ
jgi:hypothetical protein